MINTLSSLRKNTFNLKGEYLHVLENLRIRDSSNYLQQKMKNLY